MEEKIHAFGLEPIRINGHDFSELKSALSIDRTNLPSRPRVVIAETIKGKGVKLLENNREWHSKIPNEDEFKQIICDLGISMAEFEEI